MKQRSDLLGDHAQTQERVRKLEVMGSESTIGVATPRPDNEELYILAELITLFWCGETDVSANGFRGQPIGHTARWVREQLWRNGFFPEAREYYNEHSPFPWPDEDLFPDHTAAIYQQAAFSFYHLLADVGAWPYLSQFFRMGVSGDATLRQQAAYGVAEPVCNYLVGGAISGPFLAGARPWWQIITWTGLPAIPPPAEVGSGTPGTMGWVFMPRYGVEKSALGIGVPGCDGPPNLDGPSSKRLWSGVDTGYDTRFPFDQVRGQWGINPGMWAGSWNIFSSAGHEWFEFSNGYWTVEGFPERRSCQVDRLTGEVLTEASDFGPYYVASPLMPGAPIRYLGSQACPGARGSGSAQAQGCTGVYVKSYMMNNTDVSPLFAPIPAMYDYDGNLPEVFDNIYLGFGIEADLGYPGFDALVDRIKLQMTVYDYSPFLSLMGRMLGSYTPDDDDRVEFRRRRFSGDTRWHSCRVYAPWRGFVECRVLGPHVHFRGWVMVWNNPFPNQTPLVEMPHGFPAPGYDDFNRGDVHFLAQTGKIPGRPIPEYWWKTGQLTEPADPLDAPVYPDEFAPYIWDKPADVGKQLIPLSFRFSESFIDPPEIRGKWMIYAADAAGGVTPLSIASGAHVAIFDGISYIGQDDVLT